MDNIELPLLPGTVLDSILGSNPGVQKLRQELRKELGTRPGLSSMSFGRYGTTNLEPTQMFPCLVTGARWNREQAHHLARAYVNEGLEELVGSGRFKKALEIAAKMLKIALKAATDPVDLAATAVSVIGELTASNAEFRAFAREMSEINQRVDQSLAEVRRLPGRLIRMEGDEALVVIENGDREELRSLPRALLTTTGISEEGTSFVLHEMTWSPDLQGRLAIPAIDVDALDQEHERRLRSAETPLPRPGKQ